METEVKEVQQEETQAVSVEETNGKVAEDDTISVEDHKSEISKMKEMVEQIKRSQAGSDKLVHDLKIENEELKKSQMSDKERAEYEKKLYEQERINLEREKKELEKSKYIAEYFAENSIDFRFRKFIDGEGIDQIKESIEELKSLIEEQANKKLEKFRATETGKPAGGSLSNTVDQIDTSDIEQVSVKYKALLKDKGQDHAVAWLNSIKLKEG